MNRITGLRHCLLAYLAGGALLFALGGCASPDAVTKQRAAQSSTEERAYFPGEIRPAAPLTRAWNPQLREREYWRGIITKEWLKSASSVPVLGGIIHYRGKARGREPGGLFRGTITGEVLLTITTESARLTSMTKRVTITADGTIRTGERGYTYIIRHDGGESAHITLTRESATWNADGHFYALRPNQKTLPATEELLNPNVLFPDFEAAFSTPITEPSTAPSPASTTNEKTASPRP